VIFAGEAAKLSCGRWRHCYCPPIVGLCLAQLWSRIFAVIVAYAVLVNRHSGFAGHPEKVCRADPALERAGLAVVAGPLV
jgi:hypothetical protein